jgi:hypothetical protein
VKPFRESPGNPYTRSTPEFFSVSTIRSERVRAIGLLLVVVGVDVLDEARTDD